jgi:hypothetical protein
MDTRMESPKEQEFPRGAIFTTDSDYWVRRTENGNYDLGKKGQMHAAKEFTNTDKNQSMLRKMRILMYLQNRAERDPHVDLEQNTVGGEDITEMYAKDGASRNTERMADLDCYAAAAFVANPHENDLVLVKYASLSEQFAHPEAKSLEELTVEVSTALPALVVCLSSYMYAEYGLNARVHNFLAFDRDPKTKEIICFEKMGMNEPIRILSLEKIYNRFAKEKDLLWISAPVTN